MQGRPSCLLSSPSAVQARAAVVARLLPAIVAAPESGSIPRYEVSGQLATRTIDPRHFFPTVEAAVAAFREETGAEWPAEGAPETGPVSA